MNKFRVNLHSALFDLKDFAESGYADGEMYGKHNWNGDGFDGGNIGEVVVTGRDRSKEKELSEAEHDRDAEKKQVEQEYHGQTEKVEEDIVQNPDFSNIAGNVASEASSRYTDMEQVKSDRKRFQERLKSKADNGNGEEYVKIWDKKIEDGFDNLIKALEENKYFDDLKEQEKTQKKAEILVKYSKEVCSQYEKYIWRAGDKTFKDVKNSIFGPNSEEYPANKIYSKLTGAASISTSDRTYLEGYGAEILEEVDDGEEEKMSDRRNRKFLSEELPQYLWNLKKAPHNMNLAVVNVDVTKFSREDSKAISDLLKMGLKINVEDGQDPAIVLLNALRTSNLGTNSGKDNYKKVLGENFVKKEKYWDDLVRVGNFYYRTQSESNEAENQHAIYLSILKIIETEGGAYMAEAKYRDLVDQSKTDKKQEKKDGYESGEKLGATNPELYEIAKNLGITDFASATRLSEKDADYFKNTPVEKILANLNNDKVLDARDTITGGSKTGMQFLEVFRQVGKEKALPNLVKHAKLLNRTLGVGLPDTLLDANTIEADIKGGHAGLILLLQDIINKPGEDLYTLLSGHSENPFEGIDLATEKASADKAVTEMIKKMDLEALKKDGLTLPTPESMQSGLATALYTEYKRGIGLGGKVSFDQWIKGVELNTGFQIRDGGVVMVGIGIDYSKKINLGKGWSTTPELSAGGFIPLGMGKPELSGSVGLNNEVAKERITKKGVKEHLGVQGGVTLMPTGVLVLSAGLKWEQNKLEGIESAEQQEMIKFRDQIMTPVLKDVLEKRKMVRTPEATKLNFYYQDLVNTVKESILNVAKAQEVSEDKQEMVTNAVMRLLVNYNNADLAQEGVIDIIAQGVAEQYAMAWAEDRKAHITEKAYLSGASLGAFWVAGSPLVGIYAGIKFTKHDLDGYGDRWGQEYGIDHEYQSGRNETLINSFNQEAGFRGNDTLKISEVEGKKYVMIPKNIAFRVYVNEQLKGNMKKDEQGNILLHVQTPMAAKIHRGAATQGSEIIIGGKKGENFSFLDKVGSDWFTNADLNETEILNLGEGIRTYSAEIINKALADLKTKFPAEDKIQNFTIDETRMQELIAKANEINSQKTLQKVKLTIDTDKEGKLVVSDPVQGAEGRGLEIEYRANFEMIDSKAKSVAKAVYEQVLKLDANGVRILNGVKHDVGGKKHRGIYDTFNNAILEGNKNGNYAKAKDAIKPILEKLIEDCKLDKNNNGFKKALETIRDMNGAALGQALMSIDNIFARSTRVVGKEGKYTFPREGAEGMSKIISNRERQISSTIDKYLKNDSDGSAKKAYLALIDASKNYRTSPAHSADFKKQSTTASQLDNTVGFNLGDKTDPERPLFNPEIYQQMVDLNSTEFETEELKKAKNTIHERAMRLFAKNTALIAPILKVLGLEGRKVSIGKFENGKLTLDILNDNDKIEKQITLKANMNFGYFTQCVNHTIILSDISAETEDGTSVQFNSGVWEGGIYKEGDKTSIVSTTNVSAGGAVTFGGGNGSEGGAETEQIIYNEETQENIPEGGDKVVNPTSNKKYK